MRGAFGVGPVSPPRPLHPGIGKKPIGLRRLTLWLACVVSLLAGSASAHDASSYGGVFRSRDLGAAWLNADVGLFLNAALVIAVDPRDSSHLLVGTDLGILSSRNGGRSWVPEARDVIIDLPRTSNSDRRRAVIHDHYKLIAYGDDSYYQVFDIDADPTESKSLEKTERAKFDEMVALYKRKKKEIKDIGPYACRTLKGAPVGRAY